MIKTREELIAFIRDARENKGLDFNQITRQLKENGYKSTKTQRPLTLSAVKMVARKFDLGKAGGSNTNLLGAIEEILDLREISAERKIEIINGLRIANGRPVRQKP